MPHVLVKRVFVRFRDFFLIGWQAFGKKPVDLACSLG
jgi:hypothetical protein